MQRLGLPDQSGPRANLMAEELGDDASSTHHESRSELELLGLPKEEVGSEEVSCSVDPEKKNLVTRQAAVKCVEWRRPLWIRTSRAGGSSCSRGRCAVGRFM